jgi:putative transposase
VKKDVVNHIRDRFGLSLRRCCRLAQIARSSYLYQRRPNDDQKIVKAMKDILDKNNKYGSGMIHLKLLQQGLAINHKRVERIYRENGMQLATRRRRKKIAATSRVLSPRPLEPGKLWAMDFVNDSVGFQRKLKILTVLDPVTNKSPVIHSGFSITGNDLAAILAEACESQGFPEIIKVDNGPEFRSKEFDRWCYQNKIQIEYSRPGKPTDNANIESFNGTFRSECLNSHYFESGKVARRIIQDWWNEYNQERPQKRLNGMTPIEYEGMLLKDLSNAAGGRIAG